MKKIKINVEDLISVLEVLQQNGTKDVVFFEHNDLPAMTDADEPENIIMFQAVAGMDEEEVVH